MGKPWHADVFWPVGGLSRNFSYDQQPPNTTPDALNVRPFSTGEWGNESVGSDVEARLRGGSRPGLGKAYTTLLGDGNPVRMIHSMILSEEGQLQEWRDDFSGEDIDDDVWETPDPAWFPFYIKVTSITRSGTTATATTFYNHRLSTNMWVTIIGADQAVYNITAQVTVTGANTFTYTIASDPGSDATGIIFWRPKAIRESAISAISAAGSTPRTVTVTVAAGHSIKDQMEIVVAGIEPTDYNGTFRATRLSDTQFTYEVNGNPADPVDGGSATVSRETLVDVGADDQAEIDRNEWVGAIRTDLTFDEEKPYKITIAAQPFNGEHHGTYFIFARMDEDDPNPLDEGLIAEINLTGSGGAYKGSLRSYSSGVATVYEFAASSTGAAEPGVFELLIDGQQAKVTWTDDNDPGVPIELAAVTVHGHTGRRFGFAMFNTIEAGITLTDYFLITYQREQQLQYDFPFIVIASANGKLYHEVDSVFELELVDSDVLLATDRQISAANYDNVVYIADTGEVLAKGPGEFIDEKTIQVDIGEDLTGLGIDKKRHVLVVLDAIGAGIVEGAYEIDQVQETTIYLKNEVGGTGNCNFRVEPAPKKFNAYTDELELWFSDDDPVSGDALGSVPTNCPLICTYRDRIVLGGAAHAPTAWFMSRQGDPDDWDYGATDSQAAVAGANSTGGQVSDALMAFVPHSDDYLIMGCISSLWLLQGDPAYGGQLINLSRRVGIMGQKSWCYGPSGEVVFLSFDGLYILQPGANQYPSDLSRRVLPSDLRIRDEDREGYEALLEYDVRDRGVHIFITKTSDATGTSEHWFFDWPTKTFWPMSFESDHEPTAVGSVHQRWNSDSNVLLGGRDGYIRTFRDAWTDDTGDDSATVTNFSAYIDFGPYYHPKRLDGILNLIRGALGNEGGRVKWSVRGGDSPEEAFNATAFAVGYWDNTGQSYVSRPRMQARCFIVRLEHADRGNPRLPFVFEKMELDGIATERYSRQ